MGNITVISNFKYKLKYDLKITGLSFLTWKMFIPFKWTLKVFSFQNVYWKGRELFLGVDIGTPRIILEANKE